LVKVGAPLVEFAEGAEEDTGTVVGELGREEKSPPGVEGQAEVRPAWILQVLPMVRAIAHKLGVDLNLVEATGPDGTITRADVERAAKSLVEAGPAEPLRGMRRAMAQRMAAAHAAVVPTAEGYLESFDLLPISQRLNISRRRPAIAFSHGQGQIAKWLAGR